MLSKCVIAFFAFKDRTSTMKLLIGFIIICQDHSFQITARMEI